MAELEYTVERIEGDDSITVISENGDIRFVSVGEAINAGDTILSFEGGQVVLTAGGQNIVIDNSVDVFITADLASQQGNQDDEAEEINVDDDFLAALDGDGDLLDSLESTAAGSDSSGQDTDGSSFVRVERISEDVDPVAFEYAQTGNDSVQLETQEVSAADFDIEFDLGSVINEVTPTFVGTTSAPAGSVVDVLITDQNGTTQNVISVVQDDGTFTVNVGNALPEGTFTVEASITDNAGNTTTVSVSSSVDITAPIIADLTVEAGNNTPAISGSTDAEPGTAVVVTLIDGNGDSQVLNSVVQGDGSFSAIPESPLVDGDFTLVAQVTDNAGNTTSATSTGNVDTTAPVVTDTTTTDNNSDTPTFTGTTNAEPGSAVTMTVTDANGDSQVMNAVVQEDGSYSASPANALAQGEFTLVTEITDNAGNTSSDTSTGNVDTSAPVVTDTTTTDNNSDTPTFTGTTNAEPGSAVTMTVTDANGDSQVMNAVVQEDGSYSASPANALAQGEFTLVTEVTDSAVNTSSDTTTGNIDSLPPTLTVDAPDNSNDATLTITGTTDAPVNSVVNLMITGNNGAVQTLNATVQENGTYSVEVPVDLAEGNYSAAATVSDTAGNEAIANDTGSVDTILPTLTVDAPDDSNDVTPTITGTTDAPVNSVVNLTITGNNGAVQTLNATVQANGTYSAEVPTDLAEGRYTVAATVADAAGNEANASDTGSVDTILPTLTVDAPDDSNDVTPTITGTTDAPVNSVVNLTITGNNGAVQTLNATVQANGTYSAEVPTDLAEGRYTVAATVADAAGNEANASDTGNIDTIAPTLTLDALGITNDSTPLITGASDADADTSINITVTDNNGIVQTFNTSVQADGRFSVELNDPLPDGPYTVSATVEDEAGNLTTSTANGEINTAVPSLSLNEPQSGNDATPTVSGNTDAAVGTVVNITVTDQNGAIQTLTALVQNDGSFSIDVPVILADGAYSVDARVGDGLGNDAQVSGSGNIDTSAPTITVDVPDNSNDGTPTITGTTDAPVNSVVNLTITGNNGAVQTLNATVQANGTYSAAVPADLAEGSYSVQATITDTAGNEASASDTGSVDTIAPTLTVDAPDNSGDATPTITGSTDAPVNSVVNLTVTDSNDAVQTVNAIVQTNGTYSAAVPVDLAEGNYSVSATVADAAGNETIANDTGSVDTVAPTLTVDAPDNSNDATPTITGTSNEPDNAVVSLLVTDEAGVEQVLSATVLSGVYSVDVPDELAEGTYTVDASITDGAGNETTANDTGSVDTVAPSILVNAPDNTNDTTPTITGSTDAAPGSTVSIIVTGSNAAEQTFNAVVQLDGSFTADVPSALADGNFSVSATVQDEAGNSTTVNDSGSIDSAVPSLTLTAPDNTNDDTPTISGTTDVLLNGSTVNIFVMDSGGVVQNLTALVQPDGSFSVDVLASMADGNYSVTATIDDGSGNIASASDSGNIDTLAPSLNLVMPTGSDDATPEINGSTNALPGTSVAIVVTDSAGVIQNLTAIVQANGSYAIEVPLALAEGGYSVSATVADAAGNETIANDTGSVDTVAPTLTVDAPDNSNDATPTITGTSNEPDNAVVSLLVTDEAGVEQVLSATVLSGVYSVDVPDELAEGTYTVDASITDGAGNETTANDTGSVDTVAPTLTVDAPDNSSDATPTITGSTDAPVNSVVSITITGSNDAVQTVNATVQANGTYSVDVPSDLVEGSYTVQASITDAAGNETIVSDTGNVDTVAPTLTVDAPDNSNDATPRITGETNAPVASTVTITVTGSNSVEQNLTAIVQPDGSFHVDVPSALAEGGYSVSATVADAAGNETIANDTGSVDTVAPTLTVDAPDNSNDATPTITGTSNEPDNAVVSLLVTDEAGVEQVLSATVLSGVYSVDVPDELAEGTYTVDASITDGAGNETTANDTGSVDTQGPTISLTVLGDVDAGVPIISGTCSEPQGTLISVTLTDTDDVEFTLSAFVGEGGLFTVVIPATIADGDATAVISVTDVAGNETIVNATVPIDLTAPVVILDKLGEIDVEANLPSITGSCSEPQGTVISFTLTDSDDNDFTFSTVVGVDGLFTVLIPIGVAEGDAAVIVSVTDIAGNETLVNATVPIDVTAPLVVLDKLGEIDVNLGLPVITGTCNEPQGTLITVTLNDALGIDHTLTTTVGVGGLFTVAVPVTVAEGDAAVIVSVTDIAGNETLVNATVPIDVTAPLVVLDKLGEIDVNLGLPVITGTCNEPQGTLITVTLNDALGIDHTLTTTVGVGGLFTVAVPVTVAEGDAAVIVSVTDIAGNETLVNATVPIDVTAPLVVLDKLGEIDVNLGLPVITGTCNEPQGTLITVTLNDALGIDHTLTTTVGVGGLFTVAVPVTVAEGDAAVIVSVTDIAGNETLVNATVPIDVTAPLVVLDKLGEIDVNLGLPVITGTCNEPVGTLVTLTLTDSGGTDHILSSSVQAGGLILVEVPLVLAQVIEGNIGISLSVADEAGNTTTTNDTGLIDVTAPLLTLDNLDLTNLLTLGPLLTGTSSEPSGTIVSVSISALGIVTIETQAIVQEGGGFGIQLGLGLPSVIDIEASVTDLSGNTTTVLNNYSLLGGLFDESPALSAKAAPDTIEADDNLLSFTLGSEEKIDLTFTPETTQAEPITESSEVSLDMAELISDPADELFTSPEDTQIVSVIKSADTSSTPESATETLSVSLADQELMKSLIQNNSLTIDA